MPDGAGSASRLEIDVVVTGKGKLSDVEQVLGYQFRDPKWLKKALTHSSIRSEGRDEADNERLEFLGDRVLGICVAELLFDQFPTEDEGFLARRFNRLVRRETCADVARELNLGRFLELSDGEDESGGRDKDNILSNACEAVLGAVFKDGGFEPARKLVVGLWFGRLDKTGKVRPDPKSALQEWAQSRGLPLPHYVEQGRQGPDHAPSFTCEVRISGLEPTRGDGTNKRAAEQEAAVAMLLREKVWDKDHGA